MTRSVRRTLSDETGFTLVELLVTTTLLGIVLSLATVGYVTGLRVTDNNNARTEAANEAATALEAVGRAFRTAGRGGTAQDEPAFIRADHSSVEFFSTLYTSAGSADARVAYEINAARSLVETITQDGVTRQRILAHDLRNDALFRFSRCEMRNGKPQLLPITTLPLSLADRGAVRVIDTTVSVRTRERVSAPTVTAQTRTFLANVHYGNADDFGDITC